MCTPRRSIRKAMLAVLGLALFAVSVPAFADDDPPDRVARLSYLRGDVSFQPAGDDDWVQANLNRPLGTGDHLFTDNDSRVEMEVGAATLRLDAQSSFNILNLNDNVAQTELTQGVMNLHVRRVFEGQSYEVDTPTLAFVITQPGDYRVDIAPDGSSTMVTVSRGSGDVYGENNASYSVRSGQAYRFHDAALQDYEVLDLPHPDDFDGWVDSRNNRYEKSPSRQYVSEDVIGYADLDDYGGWNDTPEYGHVWYPTNVETGWAPYRSGHWAWIDPWGWTWVDNAAWGFAPFHYGRWVYASNRWGWCPGQIGARPIYAPAIVGFVGGAGWGVGINTGGPVGWFPLGPRDVYVPWYHTSRNYFTNVNVRNTTIINNTNITNVYNNYSRGQPINNANYAYRQNLAAVTAVPRDTFVGARPVNAARVQVNANQLRNANVVSRVGIQPQRASFVSADAARARAPSAQTLDRRVIARTQPPPRTAPVAARISAIERNGGQPLATQQMRQLSARTPATKPAGPAGAANRAAPQQRVQLVGQNSPKPQPLPAHAPGNPAGAAQRGGPGAATPANPNVRAPGAPGNAANPNARAPVTPTSPNGRAPGTPANPNARMTPPTREQATTTPRGQKPENPQQTGNGLPSSRFAPHPGQPPSATTGATATPRNATTPPRGANTPATGKPAPNTERAPVTRESPAGNAGANGRSTPNTPPKSTAPSNNVQRSTTTPSSQQMEQRHTTTPPTNSQRSQPKPVQQPHNAQPSQPREYTPRTAPVQQPRSVPQQERSAPVQHTAPVQQQQQQQRQPPPQQRPSLPQQQQPQPAHRAPPPPPSDKKKDDDKDKNGR